MYRMYHMCRLIIYTYIYIERVFILFQFCDIHVEVPLISMNMYHPELTPETHDQFNLGKIHPF